MKETTNRPELSIVLPTLNRLSYLEKAINSVARRLLATGTTFQLVVVDGGSTDGTCEYVKTLKKPHKVILQGEPLGSIAAVNAGCAVATGEFVFVYNDDAEIMDDALDAAMSLLRSDLSVGQVAIPFKTPSRIMLQHDTIPLRGKRWQMANFGVIRRDLGSYLGWWGIYLIHYGGDYELSMKVWNAGLEVRLLSGYAIQHWEAQDATRRENKDSPIFYEKWGLWTGVGDPSMGPVEVAHVQV